MKENRPVFLMLFFLFLTFGSGYAQESLIEERMASQHRVRSLKVTILSTMLATMGIGEWGFAALVEVAGRKILFDTGRLPDTVVKNSKSLGIDLSDPTQQRSSSGRCWSLH